MRVAMMLMTLFSAMLAGCQAPGSDGVEISHVHGLAYDPEQGAVYVATHHGIVKGMRSGDSWNWSYAGAERFDYMGFTQDAVTAGTFYSSGHPSDPRAFGGTNLGLRRSTDGGITWEQRSLKGQVDFHALTALPSGPGHLAGAWQGAIKVSKDAGLTWQDHPVQGFQVYSLSGSEGTVWAGTTRGLQRSADFVSWQDASAGRFTTAVTSVASSSDGELLLVSTGDGRTGSTYRSDDGGTTWEQLDPEDLRDAVAPVIFAFDPEDPKHAFASTAGGTIYESKDAGSTWAKVR